MAKLFEPLTIRGMTLQNRIVVSPMCQYQAVEGLLTPWHYMHYGGLATADAGLIVIEATGIEPAARISPKCTGLWTDAHEAAFTELVRNMRSFGKSKISLQITHSGRRSSLVAGYASNIPLKPEEGAWTTYAPSPIAEARGGAPPIELDRAGMDRIKNAFVATAQRAVRCGFDMVELHVAHGFLLHEFLSPIANQRTDEYGGSLENRMRYPLEVLAAVRAAIPDTMPLGMRVSGSEWPAEGQASFEIDDVVAFCVAAKRVGVDIVDVSSIGCGRGRIPFAPLFQVPFADAIRKGSELITRAVGLITTPYEAENVLQEGKADLISIGRGFLYNPKWTWHAAKALGVDLPYDRQYISVTPGYWPFGEAATAWKRQ